AFGSLSVTGRDLCRQPFLPLLEAAFVPYGDAAAIAAAFDDKTAVVILEPIQGEGGVIVPPDEYLPAVRRACTERGVLLIQEEVHQRFPEMIRDVRGRGLLIGVEIVDAKVGESLAQRMFDRNVLIAYTLNKPEVIPIEPSFVITRELLDTALSRFEDSLKDESA